ncbi:MAG: TolB family protein [Bryobacteraceae bacterium]
MNMRIRYLVFALIALAVAALVGKRLLYPNRSLHAATLSSTPSQSYLVILGVGDTAPTTWDGSITAAGGTILSLQGWRFSGTDAITGTTSWTMSTREAPPPPSATSGPMQENGVIVTIAAPTGAVTFTVKTAQGNFSFLSTNLTFGVTKSYLSGSARVQQTATGLQLTSDDEEEDFPSMAQSGDDVYLAYTEFVHGDRSEAVGQTTKATITNFAPYARPAGGDQVLFLHYSKSQQVWTGPFPVTGTGQDLMRVAVAIDGQGRTWIFYSAQRNGNFDIYACSVQANGTVSPEIQLTTDPGTDIFPVAATDATGKVWVAWQAFRNNHLEILASVQNGNTFWPETMVSTSPASNWEPAIATSADGEVAIAWDTYDKGDYDVYVRRLSFSNQVTLQPPIPIAATLDFEGRSTIVFDPQNRLWIAYEVSGPDWGKDYGSYDTTGISLYFNHTIQVRCLVGNNLYSTTNDVSTVLPGGPNTELFLPSIQPPFGPQPNLSLAENRAPNADVGLTAKQDGPKNTIPRLATDSDGTVYLLFREPAGDGLSTSEATGPTVGSIWVSAMVYFDGTQWYGPGVLADTDAVSDSRPSILPLGPGHLLLAHSMDHRLTPLPNGTPQIDGVNEDLYALDLNVTRTQQTPQLTLLPPVTPATPAASVAAEAAAVARDQSYRPTVGGQPYQLVRGDFHRHTEISFDGARDGPLIDSYRYFIDAAGLSWVGCCDHDDGSSREYTWWIMQKFTDAYTLGSKFVPMYYYERSVDYPEGHRNIMFAVRGIRPLPRLPLSAVSSSPPGPPAPDTNMLYAYLHFFNGLSAPHTSATDQGTDWRNNDPVVEPFVEIYQGCRQDYEMPGAPRANSATDSIAGFEAPGYVGNALGLGYQLGFEASSDHVSTHISYTNIWVTAPTRTAIMAALHQRHMYGSTDDILADFRSGTHFMGDSFTSSTPPVFTVRLYGTNTFDSVVVVKNGTVVYSTKGDRVVSFTWQDTAAVSGKTSYYYVRGLQTPLAGQVTGQIVWVSPMWVTMQ